MSNSAEYNAVRSKKIKLQEDIAKNKQCIIRLAERLNDDKLLPGPTLMAIQDDQNSYSNATKIVSSVLQHIEHDPSAFYKFVTHLKEVGLEFLANLLDGKPARASDKPVSRTSDISEEEKRKLAKKVLKENQIELKDVIVAGGLVNIVHACEAKGLIAEEKKRQLVDLTRGRSEDERAYELLDTIRRSLVYTSASNTMDKFLCILSNNGGDDISRQMASECGFPLKNYVAQTSTPDDYQRVLPQAPVLKTSFSEETNYEKPHCDEVEDVDFHQDGTEETEEQQEENKRLKCEKPLLTELEETAPLRKVEQNEQPFLYERIQKFCNEVQFILHTVNPNEVKAVLSLLNAPDLSQDDEKFLTKPIDLDEPNSIVLGMFGGHKCAMIQTEMGDDCRDEVEAALVKFPNAKTIIAIGVAYAQPSKDIKFGDVLVSEHIVGVGSTRENKDDSTIPKKRSTINYSLSLSLKKAFTRNPTFSETFHVASQRPSRVYCGTFYSRDVLLDNIKKRDEILKKEPEAIGGEMEGRALLRIRNKFINQDPPRNIEVIIIKGAADYADGAKTKEWQPVAAMAAARYAQDKLKVLSASTRFKSGSLSHQTAEDKPSSAFSPNGRSRSRYPLNEHGSERKSRDTRYRSRSPLNGQKSEQTSDSTEVRVSHKRGSHSPERERKTRPRTSYRHKKN